MSESTADATMRWREKELRAAWEMGRDAAAFWHTCEAARLVPNPPSIPAEWRKHHLSDASSILAIAAPDNLGDIVKEKTHGR